MATQINKGGRGKKVTPAQRVDNYPDDLILMGEVIMCKFCNCSVLNKDSNIKKHIGTNPHKKAKEFHQKKGTKPLLQTSIESGFANTPASKILT